MPRSRRKPDRLPKRRDDISFPVSFSEQAKYLELANCFLELDQTENGRNVVPIFDGKKMADSNLKKAS